MARVKVALDFVFMDFILQFLTLSVGEPPLIQLCSRNDPGQWKFTQQTKFSPSRNMKKIDKRFRANNHNSSRSDAAEIKARWRVAAKTLFVYFQSPLFSIRDVRKVFHDLKITRKSLPTLMDVELSESIAVKIISDRDELSIDFQVSR